jgi:hypothetical protein
MNFYWLNDPMTPDEYAMFSAIGTWPEGHSCPECRTGPAAPIPPLIIEWEPGTALIGDFSWGVGSNLFAVREQMEHFFSANGFSLNYYPIAVSKPTTMSKKKRVGFPYTGPTLKWSLPRKSLPLDEAKSRLILKKICSTCGHKIWADREEERWHIPKSDWNGEKIFRLSTFDRSNVSYITEDGLAVLQKHRLTNFDYKFQGTID